MNVTYEHKPTMTFIGFSTSIRPEEGYQKCHEFWIAGLYQGGEVPEGLKLYSFPESDWAMFSERGPLPGSLQTLNTQVWKEWYPNEGQKYMGNGYAMLEVYSPRDMQSPDYECGIWVPICRPEEQEEYEAAEIVSTMMITGII